MRADPQRPRGWVARLAAEGEDPDPRFTLANERTFLAWIRTSLALVAAGIGLEAFATGIVPGWLRASLAALLMLLGAVVALLAFRRWLRSERALRHGRSLPLLGLAPLLALGVAACAVALLAGLFAGP